MHFLERKSVYSSFKVRCSLVLRDKFTISEHWYRPAAPHNIFWGSGNGLSPNRWQAFTPSHIKLQNLCKTKRAPSVHNNDVLVIYIFHVFSVMFRQVRHLMQMILFLCRRWPFGGHNEQLEQEPRKPSHIGVAILEEKGARPLPHCFQCALQWRHNERNGISNHRRLHCFLKRWFRRKSKQTSKLRVIGLCVGNSPVTGEFPAQKVSNAENVSIWWRHHGQTMMNEYDDHFSPC